MSLASDFRQLQPGSVRDYLKGVRLSKRSQTKWSDPASQTLLAMKHRELRAAGVRPASINDAGFQVFSAADEDGILLYLFATFGIRNRSFVDVGAAGIEGSNTANLVVNHGWYGLHIEASQRSLDFAQSFYRSRTRSRPMPPKAICSFVTAENINETIQAGGLEGEIDFLSIDIDSNDYWVWKAVSVVQPRIVEMEFQAALGTLSKSIPYDPNFDGASFGVGERPYEVVYSGASLPALVSLGEQKGYTFVGCDSLRVNAFFVRDDVNDGFLPEADIDECLDHPRVKHLVGRYADELARLPWVDID